MIGGGVEEGVVDLEAFEGFDASRFFVFLSHGDEGVGVDGVGVFDGGGGIVGGDDFGVWAEVCDLLNGKGVDGEVGWGGDGESHGEFGAESCEAERHVVAIADEGKFAAGEVLAELVLQGECVGECLAGVRGVGECVDDGDGCVLCHLDEFFMLEDARHDAVDHAVEYASDIGDGFACAESNFGVLEDDGVTAEFVHGLFEADACAQAGFFKDHGERTVGENIDGLTFVALRTQLGGGVEDMVKPIGGVVGDVDEVCHVETCDVKNICCGIPRGILRGPGFSR